MAAAVGDPAVLRLIADGATRFLHHQIVEMAADCLAKSRDDLITSIYFCDMSQGLEDTLIEVRYLRGNFCTCARIYYIIFIVCRYA